MFRFNKKIFFVFHRIFKLVFITQIIYCIIHNVCCVFFSYFFCSLISVSKKRDISSSYNGQKFKNKMNEKRSQEYQSIDPE